MSRDFVNRPEKAETLIYRHLAWLTAMRYQMRDGRAWETASKPNNVEHGKLYSVPEKEAALEAELTKYLAADELKGILASGNKATRIPGLQSNTIKDLFERTAASGRPATVAVRPTPAGRGYPGADSRLSRQRDAATSVSGTRTTLRPSAC